MSNVVFILGAGASKHAGAPLMANFLDVASDLLRAKKVGTKEREFTQVFEAIGALQVVHSKSQLDLNNIESIFTVLELAKVIQRIPGLAPHQIPTVISSLKDLIVHTLETTMSFGVQEGKYFTAPSGYQRFANLIDNLLSRSPVLTPSVITFNYDIGVDLAMTRRGQGPDYVLSPAANSKVPIQLMKLHGSLNWATERETKQIRVFHLSTFDQHYHLKPFITNPSTIQVSAFVEDYFRRIERIDIDPEPVIVPPSWNKADYHTTLSEVWAAAAKHLSEAEYIYIMGYSLPETDSFFRHLYALGSVGNTPLRQIVIFNPDTSGATDKRFRDLLGPGALARYEYVPAAFEEAIRGVEQRLF